MATDRNKVERAVDQSLLVQMESVAVELARLAGAEIVTALGGMLAVKYKGGTRQKDNQATRYRDPVSEVDHKVEAMLRARIAENFPDHGIVGEEIDEDAGGAADGEFIWAVDPIDGTMNFINGFPLFAASIGVLCNGRPIVGAIWCATSHALHAGVYHSREGGPLSFDGVPLNTKSNPAVLRRLAGEPSLTDELGFPWEVRKTGSAAIECAFVAAGLLRVARFIQPNIWDVAGGAALIRAAGLDIKAFDDNKWTPFCRFAPIHKSAPLRTWQQSLILGEVSAVDKLCQAHTPKAAVNSA